MQHLVCAIFIFQTRSRACLKKAYRELRVPICRRFYPNEGGVAGYGNRMRVKYTTKRSLQIAEMIFQTRSSHVSLTYHKTVFYNTRTFQIYSVPSFSHHSQTTFRLSLKASQQFWIHRVQNSRNHFINQT